jgi:serine/threonine protein kinase
MSSEPIDIANSATLTQDSLANGATLIAGSVAPPISTSSVNASLRTTVLPRLEIVGAGATPQLVADGKLRYELSHSLGEGGAGEVVKARDNDIDRDVAIKRMRSELQGSQVMLLRFAEEIRTVGRLEHPNIVPIHDVGVHPNGEYYFVMKYVHGETLESIIERLVAGDAAYHAKYDFERRVEIMMGVLEAIAFAHSKRIIHRDIKPANVMIGPYGEVMVMDWGLARGIAGAEPALHAHPSPDSSGGRKLFQTQVGTLLGTPAYMSPEQARGEALDERSDIYGLCVMFYELLSLCHPHGGKQTLETMLEAVKAEPIPHALGQSTKVQAPVPADLSWFLERGLRKNKGARYQSVDEMIARLRRRAAGDIPVQCPFTFSMRVSTLVRQSIARHPFLTLAALLVGTAATLGLAIVGAMRLGS